MPFGMGFGELVLILIIVVVVFGATKLPQLGDGLGKAIKNFKRAVNTENEIDVSPGAKKAELDDDDEQAGQVKAAERTQPAVGCPTRRARPLPIRTRLVPRERIVRGRAVRSICDASDASCAARRRRALRFRLTRASCGFSRAKRRS